ncbi:HAMP domain-containing protein [Pseudomonas oryzae]|uniref:Uncharacterized membrane protein affecting hemolysin expression n=1 Tax=Pseudomonas oryzae TaxID=1392877 RepID=A0A1H1VSV0_9PSED|nr:HAMP domain-containing protein [Pseudomonas oryzae]SDS87109.1 Uncharacterized membrane protein affecting hemolysin expression [Pseudomonas oryzae]
MNRPAPVKSDNFFLVLFGALRRRRLPIALRTVSHSLALVTVVMLAFAWVFNYQAGQVMQEHSEAVGESLKRQAVTSATELLAANDRLSLKVMLDKLADNPLVAHVVVHGVDNRIIAEAGHRPPQAVLGRSEGVFSAPIAFQEVAAGQLHLTLDMQQFRQPLTISLQNFGLLGLIVLIATLFLSLRLGSQLALPLRQLRLWLRDPDDPAPAHDRQDEIGDLARQLQQRLVPPKPQPSAAAFDDTIVEDGEDMFEGLENLLDERRPAPPGKPAPRAPQALADDELELDEAALGLDPAELAPAPGPAARPPLPVVASAVLAIQLGGQEELQRRLPQQRLRELLQRYRDCLERAATLYDGDLQRLGDGGSLILFHGNQSGENFLTRALCCGELLRALGHALQIEVADCGLTLRLQLSLSRGEGLYGLPLSELLLQPAVQSTLGLNGHSRNLLLLDPELGADPDLRTRARIRALANPAGASCIERLQDPLPARLEQQLGQMLQRA